MSTFVGRFVAAGALVALAAGGATWSRGVAPVPGGPREVEVAAVAAWSAPGTLHPHLGAHPRLRRLICHVARWEAVLVVAGQDRTVELDHGTVRAASPGQLILELLDGKVATVRLSEDARVFRDGRRVDPEELEPGDVAFALSVDGRGRAVRAFHAAHDPCPWAAGDDRPPARG